MTGLRPARLRADLFDQRTWSEASRGRSVIVTGAAGGLGRAVVGELLTAGARVTVTDRPESDLAHFDSLNGVCVVPGDIAEPSDCEQVVRQATAAFGGVDVVINNAGAIHVAVIQDHEIGDWQRVFRVNVEGTFLMAQACIRQMLRQDVDPASGRRGLIVNIGSRAADAGRPFTTAYAASKAAVVHLSMSLAQAFADDTICTTVVYPADIMTPMFMGVCERIAALEGVTLEQFIANRPMESVDTFAPVVMSVVSSHAMEFNGALVRHGVDDVEFRAP